ncbi:hypothetical protein FF1_021608 [Malus domestica]
MSVIVGASWQRGKQSSIPRTSRERQLLPTVRESSGEYHVAFYPFTSLIPVILLSSVQAHIFFPTKKKKKNQQQNSIYKKRAKRKKYSEKSANGDVGREIATVAESFSLSDGLVITTQPLHTTLWVWRQRVPTRASSPIHTHFPISSQTDRFHGVSNALNRKSPENVEILNPNPSPFPTFRAAELRIRFSPPPRRKPRKEKFKPAKSWMRRALCFPSRGVEGWGACLSGGSYGGWWVRIRCIEVEGL